MTYANAIRYLSEEQTPFTHGESFSLSAVRNTIKTATPRPLGFRIGTNRQSRGTAALLRSALLSHGIVALSVNQTLFSFAEQAREWFLLNGAPLSTVTFCEACQAVRTAELALRTAENRNEHLSTPERRALVLSCLLDRTEVRVLLLCGANGAGFYPLFDTVCPEIHHLTLVTEGDEGALAAISAPHTDAVFCLPGGTAFFNRIGEACSQSGVSRYPVILRRLTTQDTRLGSRTVCFDDIPLEACTLPCSAPSAACAALLVQTALQYCAQHGDLPISGAQTTAGLARADLSHYLSLQSVQPIRLLCAAESEDDLLSGVRDLAQMAEWLPTPLTVYIEAVKTERAAALLQEYTVPFTAVLPLEEVPFTEGNALIFAPRPTLGRLFDGK